jgi:ABC-type Mn2+/Zn2+ transport system ATPase subunit
MSSSLIIENGAGKSTLMRTLIHVLADERPDQSFEPVEPDPRVAAEPLRRVA